MPSALAAGAQAPSIGPPRCRRGGAGPAGLGCTAWRLQDMCHVMLGITCNELTLPTAHAAQQTEDV